MQYAVRMPLRHLIHTHTHRTVNRISTTAEKKNESSCSLFLCWLVLYPCAFHHYPEPNQQIHLLFLFFFCFFLSKPWLIRSCLTNSYMVRLLCRYVFHNFLHTPITAHKLREASRIRMLEMEQFYGVKTKLFILRTVPVSPDALFTEHIFWCMQTNTCTSFQFSTILCFMDFCDILLNAGKWLNPTAT